MRPMVHTEKHYVATTLTNIAVSGILNKTLIESVAVASKDATQEVEEGSSVSAIYVEMWVITNGTGIGSGLLTLEKVPAAATAQTFAQAVNLGAYPNKKNIFYTTQGITAGNAANPIPLIRQWFKIPKGKQRFGLGDKLNLNIANISGGFTVCGIATYKEQK